MTDRSYSEIRHAYDEAVHEVDQAIEDMDNVVRQLREWQSGRSVGEMRDKCLRDKIEFHKLADIKHLVHEWQKAAHDEWNCYNNLHDDTLLPPRNWYTG